MGLALWLQREECPTCNSLAFTENVSQTYNVSPMWYLIFPSAEKMMDIDGLTGNESMTKLKFALEILTNEPDKFIPLNPSNGWGSYENFKKYISDLIEMAQDHPDWIWMADR